MVEGEELSTDGVSVENQKTAQLSLWGASTGGRFPARTRSHVCLPSRQILHSPSMRNHSAVRQNPTIMNEQDVCEAY